ncbi:MAG: MarR family transcriptional regulator [Candidatus Eisenbacteria bacterium]|nr:MarR family transcriptional regulator [Candidatus Eisenbacteria bacterium]
MISHVPPPGNGDEDLLSLRVARISHVFANAVREILETRILRECAPAPLSIHQVHLLKLIEMNGSARVGEVAGFLGVSAPAASKNVDKLARLGLLDRITPAEDRRSIDLRITAEGREFLRLYRERRVSGLQPVLGNLTDQERVDLASLLGRFTTLLLRREEGDGKPCLRCGGLVATNCPFEKEVGPCPYHRGGRESTGSSG